MICDLCGEEMIEDGVEVDLDDEPPHRAMATKCWKCVNPECPGEEEE